MPVRKRAGPYNPTGKILSRRSQQVVNRLRKHYLEKSRQDSEENPPEDMDGYVCDEFNRAEVNLSPSLHVVICLTILELEYIEA